MKIKYSARASSVLYNALMANKIKGKVLMPSNICESVPATYMLLGIQPVFCDISATDYQLDKNNAIEILDNSPISVLHYNHTYGYICANDELFLSQVKNRYPNIFIVDDRCLCFPEFCLKNAIADVTLYSTGPLKCVDVGWGGFGIIQDYMEYYDYKLDYSVASLDKFNRHIKECHNTNMPISRSIVLSNWLDMSSSCEFDYYDAIKKKGYESIEHKKIINNIYSCIPGALSIDYCNWRYQLLLENARECITVLFDSGLYCSNHYKSLGNGYFSDIATPVNNYLEAHIVNLFNDFRFTYEQAEKVVDILQKKAIPVTIKETIRRDQW